ncbi:hypothetical protein AAMO2058_000662300 [Amorphochlora amoebiformis]
MPGLVGYAQAGALLSLISLILPVEGKGKACLAVSRSRVAFRPLDRLKLAGRTPRYARKVASHATQVSVRSSTPDESLFLNQAPPPPAWKDIDNMRYTSWAEKVDIQGSKVAVKTLPGSLERGLYAEVDIAEGELVVGVPSSMILKVTSNPKERCPRGLVDEELWKTSPWYVKLAYVLLGKKKMRQKEWVPHLDALPTRFETPVHWEPTILNELQYDALIGQVNSQKEEFLRRFRDLKATNVGIAKAVNAEEFVWAMECVRSRSFMGPDGGDIQARNARQLLVIALAIAFILKGGDTGRIIGSVAAASIFGVASDLIVSQKRRQYVMPAFADMANHRSTANATKADINFWNGDVTVFAGTPVKEGEQVYVSYGDKSNDALLQYYGFVEDNNPNDVYIVQKCPDKLRETSIVKNGIGEKAFDTTIRKMKEAGWGPNLESLLILASGDLAPASALMMNTLLSGNPNTVSQWTDDLVKGTESALSEPAKQAMKELCGSELKAKPTTIEDDETLLKEMDNDESDSSRFRQLAIKFRISKKEILETAQRQLS